MHKIKNLIVSTGFILAIYGFTLPELPYKTDALEPVMSRETVEYHHGRHVKAYVDKLNQLTAGTDYENASLTEIVRTSTGSIFNNGAQIVNHILFFDGLCPEAEAKGRPSGELSDAIMRDFGSFDDFKKKFRESAGNLFGSGWTWLISDADGNLGIMTTQNADNPLRNGKVPLIAIDMWEHSYYIDYRNEKNNYLNNIWKIVDWDMVEKRYSDR